MDKPDAMPLKEYLLKIMSVRLNAPVTTIDAIMSHQFESVTKAMQTPGIHSIEVSGFGKFLFNHKKAIKKWEAQLLLQKELLEKLKDADISQLKRDSLNLKLSILSEWIEKSKPKIDGIIKDMGGLEKPITSTRAVESSDREDSSREVEHMPGV